MHPQTYRFIPEKSLTRLVMAGALGSMLGTLLLESIRGEKPVVGWFVLATLVVVYSFYARHPLTAGQLEAMIAKQQRAENIRHLGPQS